MAKYKVHFERSISITYPCSIVVSGGESEEGAEKYAREVVEDLGFQGNASVEDRLMELDEVSITDVDSYDFFVDEEYESGISNVEKLYDAYADCKSEKQIAKFNKAWDTIFYRLPLGYDETCISDLSEEQAKRVLDALNELNS